MSRVLWTGAVFVVFASPCVARQAPEKPELLIRLSVTPAPQPEPALKYLLLPEMKELSPGNPIQAYLKCILQKYPFTFDEEAFDRRQSLLAMPLEEVPGPEDPELGRSALAQVDAAARLDNADWQILLKLRADGISVLLPDVQALRSLARGLQARFRAEVADGRIDDAIRTNKTMFAMARHMGEHPTIIGGLVGFAMVNMAFTPLEELLQRPECPNLYWALTNLPDPVLSIRTGMDGERMVLWSFFRELDQAVPMSPERIEKFVDPLDKLLTEGVPVRLRAFLTAQTKDAEKVAQARKHLVDSGLPEVSIKAFPPEQAILLDDVRKCHARFDEMAKIMGFPAWRFEELAEKYGKIKKEPSFFGDALLPFLFVGRRAQGRIEQRIALLRQVEALRMYAAEHGGAFPVKLSDLSVPLPDDPFTGKPFLYEASGKTAHVRGTPPKAMENERAFRVHYEITLKN
jgi:hypothetical protein